MIGVAKREKYDDGLWLGWGMEDKNILGCSVVLMKIKRDESIYVVFIFRIIRIRMWYVGEKARTIPFFVLEYVGYGLMDRGTTRIMKENKCESRIYGFNYRSWIELLMTVTGYRGLIIEFFLV